MECRVLSNDTANWRNTRCSQRSASQATVLHTLRPCCGELNGLCTLTSPQHCWFMNGRFHLGAEHCSQVLKAHMNSNDWYLLFFVNQWEKLRLTETTGCKRGVCNKTVPKLPPASSSSSSCSSPSSSLSSPSSLHYTTQRF